MPTHQPLVSIVIPVWNTEEAVEKLVRRLFAQTYKSLEIIAVDDGSTDGSLAMLQGLAKKDSRLKVIHQENAGVSAARNMGIENACGKYLVFIDSDDDVTADFVEKLTRGLELAPEAALIVTGMRYNKLSEQKEADVYVRSYHGRRRKESRADYLLGLMLSDGRMYSSVNKMFRSEVVKAAGIKFEEGRDFAEDTKFVLDYLEHATGEIEFILEPLYHYNFGTETSTVKASSTQWQNWERSYADLRCWAKKVSGGELHLKTVVLLLLIRLRWRVSHYRAKKRAKRS